MFPLLSANDEVLVDFRAYRHQPPYIGDIVIAHHPTQVGLLIIKRIKGEDKKGLYQLRGDNPDLGQNSLIQAPHSQIIGRVTSRFAEVF